jgi:FkbM family methyltransferase
VRCLADEIEKLMVIPLLDRLKLNAVTLFEWAAYKPRRSFSQFGEDAVLQALIPTFMNGPGFYVDVGAFAPKTFSNTHSLYKQGWRGINIDPTPGAMRAFRLMRRRDINLEIAISDTPDTITFYQLGRRTVLNTVSREVAEAREKELDRASTVLLVRAQTLASVLDEHAQCQIDLLSVDTEGHDLVVLKSNDWTRHRPTLVLVEDHSVGEKAQAMSGWEALGASPVTAFLTERRYALCAWAPPTVFFRRLD